MPLMPVILHPFSSSPVLIWLRSWFCLARRRSSQASPSLQLAERSTKVQLRMKKWKIKCEFLYSSVRETVSAAGNSLNRIREALLHHPLQGRRRSKVEVKGTALWHFPKAPARCRISLYFSNVRNGFSSSGLNVLNVSAKFKQNSILSVTLTFPPCTGWCSRCELGCAFAEERYWTSRTSCTVYEYDIVWHSMTHHISSLMTATRRNGETKHQSGPIQSGPTLLAYPGVSCSGFSLLMLDTGVTRMLSTSKHQDSVMHFRARS